MTERKPITGKLAEKPPKVVPGKYNKNPIELSWDIKFSRWVQRIVEGIKRGYMATEKYEPDWKKVSKRIVVFIESLVKIWANLKK